MGDSESHQTSKGESWPARVPSTPSGFAGHAPGFMPGVLTIRSREMVKIPRDKLGGIALATQAVDWRLRFPARVE
jgi:hypothetical protein